MVALPISEQLAQRLANVAKRRNLSIEEYLEGVVEQDDTSPPAQEKHNEDKGSLASLARSLSAANFHSGHTDTSTRSREILETEYADYLLNRHQRSQEDA
jgi:hypothetical protein